MHCRVVLKLNIFVLFEISRVQYPTVSMTICPSDGKVFKGSMVRVAMERVLTVLGLAVRVQAALLINGYTWSLS